jgi:hypothetical protein
MGSAELLDTTGSAGGVLRHLIDVRFQLLFPDPLLSKAMNVNGAEAISAPDACITESPSRQ